MKDVTEVNFSFFPTFRNLLVAATVFSENNTLLSPNKYLLCKVLQLSSLKAAGCLHDA